MIFGPAISIFSRLTVLSIGHILLPVEELLILTIQG